MKTSTTQIRLATVVLALLSGSGFAHDRDSKADLITISARVVMTYSSVAHKAGDADGQFIEDVVIPAVRQVVVDGGPQLSNAQYLAALNFVVVSDRLASESISDIAASLYLGQKVRLCSSIADFNDRWRKIVLSQIGTGLAASGQSVPSVICARPHGRRAAPLQPREDKGAEDVQGGTTAMYRHDSFKPGLD